jgi:hypothetical protein
MSYEMVQNRDWMDVNLFWRVRDTDRQETDQRYASTENIKKKLKFQNNYFKITL